VRYVGEAIALVLAESPAIADDALALIDVDIEALPAGCRPPRSAKDESLLFPDLGHLAINSTPCARCRAAFQDAPYSGAEASHPRATCAAHGAARVLAEWDAERGRLTVPGRRAKVLFFKTARTLGSRWVSRKRDARSWRTTSAAGSAPAGEFYPEISSPVRGAPTRPSREVTRTAAST